MLRSPDLIAGVAASALLLVLVLGLGLGTVPSLALAVVAYLGVRLALPRPAGPATSALPPAEALKRCQQHVTEIRTLARRLPARTDDGTRQRIGRIGERAGQILAVIRDDPAKRGAAEAYLTGYLEPIHALLSRYVTLAERDVESAGPALARAEQETLPTIETGLDRLYEKLHAEDIIDLEVASEMLDLRFLDPRFEERVDGPR
jgi:hypothetical protein